MARQRIATLLLLHLAAAAGASAAVRVSRADASATSGSALQHLNRRQRGSGDSASDDAAWAAALRAASQKNSANCFYALSDLVLPYGYPLEEHFVTTQDGYILRMYRIPHGRDPLYRRDAGSKQAQQGEGGAATAAAAAAARAAEAAAAMAGAAVAGAAVAVGNVVEGAVGGVLSVASTAAKAASTRVVRAADDRAGEGQDTAGEGRDAAAAVDAAPAANDAAPEQVAEGAGSGGPGAATGLGADAAETQWQQQEQEQADGSSSVPGAGAGAGAGPHDVNARRGPPLLLQHGLLDSAAEFLVLGPEKALAFLLADAGYDVWLANSRGNAYSRNHTRLDLKSDEYWGFSFDEMAQYDLPAELDYILRATGREDLAYVAFSQGTTIGFAALSSYPEVAKRIRAAVMLAPVAFLQHINSIPLLVLATLDSDMLFRLLGIQEFLPSQPIIQLLEGQLCYIDPRLCLNILAAINGFNTDNLDPKKIPTYIQYTPSGASVQNLAHWAQCVRQPVPHILTHFDWGSDCIPRTGPVGRCNHVKYGTDKPPEYRLQRITTPMMIATGGQDRLADPTDVEYLREVLPRGVVQKEVHVEQYQHLDFVWGENADRLLYRSILDFLAASYTPGGA